MRLPDHLRLRPDGLDIKMTPMIDVVFLLLVFFVWTASFGVVERLLPSDVATVNGSGSTAQANPELIDFEQVVIRIRWNHGDPQWSLNDRPLADLGEVNRALAQIAAIKSELPVVIDPEPAVRLGAVIDVYDVSRQLGFSSVHFTANASDLAGVRGQ